MAKHLPEKTIHTFAECDRITQFKLAMDTLADFIKLKHGDVINSDGLQPLVLSVNFEVCSGVSNIMVKPIL